MTGATPVRRLRPDRYAAALLVAATLLLTGCVAAGRIGPVGSKPPDGSPDGLRALYRTTVHYGGEIRSFRVILAAVPPDRLRLEILGPLGSARLILAIDPAGAVGLFPHDGLFFRHPDPVRVIEALLGARVGVVDLIAVWIGGRFPDAVRSGGAAGAGLRFDLRLDPRTGLVRGATLVRDEPGGETILVAGYPDRTVRQAVPRRIELEVPRTGLRIVSRLQRGGAAAPGMPADLFRPAVPDSYRRVDLRELDRGGPWIVPGG